jgi:hypothetical protein
LPSFTGSWSYCLHTGACRPARHPHRSRQCSCRAGLRRFRRTLAPARRAAVNHRLADGLRGSGLPPFRHHRKGLRRAKWESRDDKIGEAPDAQGRRCSLACAPSAACGSTGMVQGMPRQAHGHRGEGDELSGRRGVEFNEPTGPGAPEGCGGRAPSPIAGCAAVPGVVRLRFPWMHRRQAGSTRLERTQPDPSRVADSWLPMRSRDLLK